MPGSPTRFYRCIPGLFGKPVGVLSPSLLLLSPCLDSSFHLHVGRNGNISVLAPKRRRSEVVQAEGRPRYGPLRSCSPQALACLLLLLSGVWKWKSQNQAFFGELSHVRTRVPLLCFKSQHPFCGSSQTAHSSDTQTPQESQPCVYTFLQPLCGRASTFPCSTLLLFHIFQSFFLFSSLLTPSLPSCASLLQQKIVSGDLCPVMDWWPPPGCCPALFPPSDSDGSIALWPIRHIIWVNSKI